MLFARSVYTENANSESSRFTMLFAAKFPINVRYRKGWIQGWDKGGMGPSWNVIGQFLAADAGENMGLKTVHDTLPPERPLFHLVSYWLMINFVIYFVCKGKFRFFEVSNIFT